MGRESKLTPEVKEKILSALRAGNYANVAAEYAGISETTFYRWLRKGREAKRGIYREFFAAVQRAEREAEVRAVAILQRHMDDNWQAAMTYLERKFPERWGRRDHLKVDIDPKETLAQWLAVSEKDLEEAVELFARGEAPP